MTELRIGPLGDIALDLCPLIVRAGMRLQLAQMGMNPLRTFARASLRVRSSARASCSKRRRSSKKRLARLLAVRCNQKAAAVK